MATWIKFLTQAVVVVGAAILGWLMLGPRVYLIVAVCMVLIVFALVITNSARSATSSNPNPEVILQPIPWVTWTLGSMGVGLVLGAFWPLLPLLLVVHGATKTLRPIVRGGADHADERP